MREGGNRKRAAIAYQEESVLKSVGLRVHLVGPESEPDPDVMLAADHVEGIVEGENIGTALEGGKATIAQGPVTREHLDRSHAATHAVSCGLVHDACRLCSA